MNITTPKPAADDVFVPRPQVRKRYGVSDMTIHRWLRDERMGFPRPIKIRGRCYFRESELVAFERSRVAERGGAS
ncbi:helix-turn-helix transcriptional regulator [Roseitalea porphyridii]|uniref:DNA-binding protein n=1 Tax=Roseitalea porphyridii TaxID=1852022 RepID=A0A4P6V0F2_9HYPH|nr:helix-turn-helix domain-containing protein [Roseitalea porphyridii]QBK30781.1 DNA-binding protein [Roseitalea porphyridii]